MALTHNLLVLLRWELEREHGVLEEKVERKRATQLIQGNTKARAQGRNVAAVQLTAQFIRSLRNTIFTGMR